MSLILSAEWGRYGFAILTSFCLGTAVSRVLQSRRQLPIDVSALQDEDVDSDDEVFAEEEQSTDPSKMILCVRTGMVAVASIGEKFLFFVLNFLVCWHN